jgi:hypothetical protein
VVELAAAAESSLHGLASRLIAQLLGVSSEEAPGGPVDETAGGLQAAALMLQKYDRRLR